MLSPEQILARLPGRLDLLKGGRDADPRQQTLRATIAWSYDLLSTEEQRQFARLAVFGGGCTIEAAEEVTGATLDILQSLLEKSLLRHTQERFWMLETIREYAAEELKASGETEEVRDRHARFFLGLAQEAARESEAEQPAGWILHLDDEHDNFRATLEYFHRSGASDPELCLAAAIWSFWFDWGYWEETRRVLEHALASSSGATSDRVKALHGAAWIAWRHEGDIKASKSFAEDALMLSRELGDERLIARSLRRLAAPAQAEGDWEQATALLEESALLSRSIGDLRGIASATSNLAHRPLLAGNYRGAADLFDETLSIARQLGNKRDCAAALLNLGQAERGLGEYRLAATHLTESLSTARELGFREVIVEALYALAAVAASTGDKERAATLIGAAQSQADFGHELEEFERKQLDQTMKAIRPIPGEANVERALEAGHAMTLDAALEYATTDTDHTKRPIDRT